MRQLRAACLNVCLWWCPHHTKKHCYMWQEAACVFVYWMLMWVNEYLTQSKNEGIGDDTMCIQAISFYHSIYHLITCSILYVCVHSVLIITHGPDYAWCLSIKTLTSEKEFVKSSSSGHVGKINIWGGTGWVLWNIAHPITEIRLDSEIKLQLQSKRQNWEIQKSGSQI